MPTSSLRGTHACYLNTAFSMLRRIWHRAIPVIRDLFLQMESNRSVVIGAGRVCT